VVVEPDDDASYWCANLDTLHHITGRANLLVHIVKLGLCRAQLLGDLLGRRRTQLRDLLLGTRDALLGVGETSEQIPSSPDNPASARWMADTSVFRASCRSSNTRLSFSSSAKDASLCCMVVACAW
jgi:hypothetical protein